MIRSGNRTKWKCRQQRIDTLKIQGYIASRKQHTRWKSQFLSDCWWRNQKMCGRWRDMTLYYLHQQFAWIYFSVWIRTRVEIECLARNNSLILICTEWKGQNCFYYCVYCIKQKNKNLVSFFFCFWYRRSFFFTIQIAAAGEMISNDSCGIMAARRNSSSRTRSTETIRLRRQQPNSNGSRPKRWPPITSGWHRCPCPKPSDSRRSTSSIATAMWRPKLDIRLTWNAPSAIRAISWWVE